MTSVDSFLDNTRKHSLRAVSSRVDQHTKDYRLLVTNHKIALVIANAVNVVVTFSGNRVLRLLENVLYGVAPTRVTVGMTKKKQLEI